MNIEEVKSRVHPMLFSRLEKDFKEFRRSQEKSITAGLLDRKNLLVCTPTASGKTLIAELAMLQGIYNNIGKGIYVVPLKALASEKYEYFKETYPDLKVAISIGDTDSSDTFLDKFDIIITVSEKLDSLIRHHATFLRHVATIVIDEVHLLNDPSRGPTLEVVITLLKEMLKKAQFIALSATIGNPKDLAHWLDAALVEDDWRPIELKRGIYLDGEVEFY